MAGRPRPSQTTTPELLRTISEWFTQYRDELAAAPGVEIETKHFVFPRLLDSLERELAAAAIESAVMETMWPNPSAGIRLRRATRSVEVTWSKDGHHSIATAKVIERMGAKSEGFILSTDKPVTLTQIQQQAAEIRELRDKLMSEKK